MDEGFDIVSGWRMDRKEPFLSRRLPSLMANRMISSSTGVALHDYGCSLKAYRREVVKNIHLYGELHRFIPAVASVDRRRPWLRYPSMTGRGASVRASTASAAPSACSWI